MSSPAAAPPSALTARVVPVVSRLPLLAWIGALAVWPAMTLASIVRNAENVPWWDEWTLVPLFQKHQAGTLGFADFWAQHNEHRPVIPRAIDFGMALLTDWNLPAEMYRNFAVAVIVFVVLLLALRRSLDRVGFAIASVVASIVFFSPMQWENWLWGWELEWFLSMLAALGLLWALTGLVDRRPRLGLAAAAACGLVAAFSLGSGLLVWPVGLLVLRLRRRPWRVWALLTVAVFATYLKGYVDYGIGSKTLFLEHPWQSLEYVCLYIGWPFAGGVSTGVAAGAVLVVTFAVTARYVVWRRDADRELVDRAAFWIGAGLYVLAGAALTAVSRLSAGVEQAGSSRYSGHAGLFAIATLTLVYVVLRAPAPAGFRPSLFTRRRIMADAAVALAAVALLNWSNGLDAMDNHGRRLDVAAACTRRALDATDPCFSHPRSSPYIEQGLWMVWLRKHGYAGYRPLELPRSPAPVTPRERPEPGGSQRRQEHQRQRDGVGARRERSG